MKSIFRLLLLIFFLFIPATFAELRITVEDQQNNPIADVRIQLTDENSELVRPPKPRADGLIGFVTDKSGQVKIDVPNGKYTIYASPDLDSGKIDESFLIVREVNAPNSLSISVSETVPVTVTAIGKDRYDEPNPLFVARVYFRPIKGIIGYVGLTDFDGELKTFITPGKYDLVIKGSIALHYVVLPDEIVSAPETSIIFDGMKTPVAKLKLELPEETKVVLHEVLATDRTQETIDIVENTVGYDAAYTDAWSLAFGKDAKTLSLITDRIYQLNLSFVAEQENLLHAYELRIENLKIETPKSYPIGNKGHNPFKISVETDRSEYFPGDFVTVNYEISDDLGNKLYRIFNYSGARLIFPFVTVRSPNGKIVASNQILDQLPEDFFRFRFPLPSMAESGIYTVNVSIDAKLYGELQSEKVFQVRSDFDESETVPIVSSQVFGSLESFKLEPGTLSLVAKSSRKIRAIATDREGNELEISPRWSVRGGVGTIRNGIFTAERSGDGEIVATIEGIVEAIPVTVRAGPLYYIATEPFISYLPISTDQNSYRQKFHALGTDILGNPVPIDNLRWTVDAGAGDIDKNGVMTSIRAINPQTLGDVVTNGSIWAFGDSENGTEAFPGKSLVVIQNSPPGQIEHLEVVLKNFDRTLENFTISVGDSQKFEAIGKDRENRRITIFPRWLVSGKIGTVQPNGFFVATRPGNGTIIATDRGRTASTRVTVTPGILEAIELQPSFLTLGIGDFFALKIVGLDRFGWEVPIGHRVMHWSIDENIARIDENGKVEGVAIGTTQVAVKIGSLVGRLQLFVRESADLEISHWKIIGNTPTVVAGATLNLSAIGTTLNGNSIELQGEWSYLSDREIGHITNNGIFTASQIGTGQIVAQLQARNFPPETVPIEVVPNRPEFARLEPSEIIVKNGVTNSPKLEFLTFDRFGNRAKFGENSVIWEIVGDVGSISEAGIFTPAILDETSEDRVGAVVATVPGTNLVGRATIFSYATTGEISELWIEPNRLELSPGDDFKFRLRANDLAGHQIEVEPTWSVDGGDSVVATDGRLTVDAEIGSILTVAGIVDGGFSTTAEVEVVEIPPLNVEPETVLTSIDVKIYDGEIALEEPYSLISGKSYFIEVVGKSIAGESVEPVSELSLIGNVAKLSAQSANPRNELQATFPGDGQLLVNASGIGRSVAFSVEPLLEIVGNSGGVMISPIGVELRIPEGSIGSEREVEISMIPLPGALAGRVSEAIEISPGGLILQRSALLSFVSDEVKTENLNIVFWSELEEKWIALASKVDLPSKSVSIVLNHFGIFALSKSSEEIELSENLRLTGLRLEPPVFYAPEINRLTIEYKLSGKKFETATVTIEIFDLHDRLVKKVISRELRMMGRNVEQWDGRSEDGEFVRNGRYFVFVKAEKNDETAIAHKLLVLFK